ncbi:hypothetical protein ABOM_009354 [Aspergillus bombycis]|uniref:Uncharacterized protein n=1 Tax=Aspergillus bombycis TaxID=109264 RepID=A0A1F7ZS02_9EURO|nr:hypothetical protein ABOM_009354 [Aspergillus bombycis]OGM42197.1 hypothetical protein ABOM_009354 [Aspergillus bombycis]
MQSLWSRAASARSSCHCVSCLSTATPGLTSRAASAASKRRLRIGNSVTALYTSIFAAAALADAQAKDQRRHEWQEKIAAVKEEVNELVDEEQRLLATILARRKRRSLFNGVLTSRQYSTFARSSPGEIRNTTRSISTPSLAAGVRPQDNYETRLEDGIETILDKVDEYDRKVLEDLVADSDDPVSNESNEEYGFTLGDDTFPEWLSYDIVRQKAIRKLAVKQLAIRLLLRPVIAHSYMGLRMNYISDSLVPKLNVAELLHELNQIRLRLQELKTKREVNIDDLAQDLRVRNIKEMVGENIKLDQQVRRDTDLYLEGAMSLQELLLRLSSNLLQATDPDRPYALGVMLYTFTKCHQNDLGDLVLKTVLPNKFPLSSAFILSTITFYRKSKNLKAFDLFLEMLCGDSYPVDMSTMGYFKRTVVHGVEISIPPSNMTNSIMYSALIIACLRFNQPDRANAYQHAARAAGYMDDFSTLFAYLKFYGIRRDWKKGVETIKRSLAFMASSTEHKSYSLERLVVLMVHLCDTCGRYDVSEAIIVAAVENGFDWRSAQKQTDITFSFDPHFRRWHVAADSSTIGAIKDQPLWERSYAFVNTVGEQLNDLTLPEEEDSARKWHKLVGTYSQEVLSAVLAGRVAEYKKPEEDGQQNLLKTIDVENNRFYNAETTAKAHQKEILALKDQVTQLKRMVFDLTKQSALGHSQPSPQDLGQLKDKLRHTNSRVLEPSAANIRYVGN